MTAGIAYFLGDGNQPCFTRVNFTVLMRIDCRRQRQAGRQSAGHTSYPAPDDDGMDMGGYHGCGELNSGFLLKELLTGSNDGLGVGCEGYREDLDDFFLNS